MPLPTLDVPKFSLIDSKGNTIQYRPFLVKEEKLMLMARESNDPATMLRSVIDLVNVCTFDKINALELPIVDLCYLMINIRARSVGETSQFRLKCKTEGCDNLLDVSLDLTKIEIRQPENPVSNIVQLQPGIKVELKPPTAGLTMLVNGPDKQSTAHTIIPECIVSVITNDQVYTAGDWTAEEMERFVSSLTRQQCKDIVKYLVNQPYLKETVSLTCSKCNNTHDYEFEGVADFFGSAFAMNH